MGVGQLFQEKLKLSQNIKSSQEIPQLKFPAEMFKKDLKQIIK